VTDSDVVRRYFRCATSDVDEALTLFTPDAEFDTPMGPSAFPDGVRALLGGYADSFPDSGFEITNLVQEGDRVAVEGFWSGTHTGAMRAPNGAEIPATNRPVRIPFSTFLRVRDGKIASHRAYWDLAGFMAQLGLG
jgi:steroid delta-isomerase-like uncharacterized protein